MISHSLDARAARSSTEIRWAAALEQLGAEAIISNHCCAPLYATHGVKTEDRDARALTEAVRRGRA